MTKSGAKKRKKLSNSSSTEVRSTDQNREGKVSDSGRPATMATNESVSEIPSMADVWKVLTEIKLNTERLVLDVDSLKGNYKELRENLLPTKSQVDTLVKENDGLKSKVKYLEDQISTSKKELENMEVRLNDVETDHDDLEQYTRKFNLVIHGIPEQKEEDNVENVIKLGQFLEVNLTRGDIDIVHRMQTKSNGKPRPIIACFSNYNAKSKLYKARLGLRNVTLQDLGTEKIFINENLTAWRAELFKEARKVRKKCHNGKTWPVDGKIFLKTDSLAKVLRIKSYKDLKAL